MPALRNDARDAILTVEFTGGAPDDPLSGGSGAATTHRG
jgi:hypothetical protein